MLNIRKNKIELFFVQFMTFFVFAGYFVGLSLILSSGYDSLTRFYSVPIRVLQFFIALIFIINYVKKIKIRSIDFYIFVFFILYTTKVIFTELVNINNSLNRYWYEYILYFILYNYSVYLFYRNLNIKKYLNTIINVLLFSGFILTLFVYILYKDLLFASQVGRFGSSLTDEEGIMLSPLSLAYSGALNLSLLIPYVLNNYNKLTFLKKIYYFFVFLSSLFIFVLGSTRGALVVVLLSLIFVFLSQSLKGKLKYLLFLVPLVISFFIFIDATGSSLVNRSKTTINDLDSSGRDRLWNAAIDEFISNPLIGGRIEVSMIYPHNIILEILMSMGLVGFFLFLLIIYKTFKRIKIDNEQIYLIIIFINGFAQYMFSGSIYAAIILFFGIGLLNGYKINLNEK